MFIVPNEAYQAFLMMNNSIINFEIRNQSATNTESSTQSSAESEASRRRRINNNTSSTNTGTEIPPELLVEIDSLDLSTLSKYGITKNLCKEQFQRNAGLDFDKFTDLLFRFGVYMDSKPLGKQIWSGRGYFISLVQKLANGETPLDHIESPTDQLLREYAETRERALRERQDLEERAVSHAFVEWLDGLDDDEKKALVPENQGGVTVPLNSTPHDGMLKAYFVANVWPERKLSIVRDSTTE
jgi:hypothetical protein